MVTHGHSQPREVDESWVGMWSEFSWLPGVRFELVKLDQDRIARRVLGLILVTPGLEPWDAQYTCHACLDHVRESGFDNGLEDIVRVGRRGG